MSEVRCPSCSHYLGESLAKLVYVEAVKHSSEVTISPPRDLRPCKSCGQVNVFVSRTDLGHRLGTAA